jgi:UPF0755 protein
MKREWLQEMLYALTYTTKRYVRNVQFFLKTYTRSIVASLIGVLCLSSLLWFGAYESPTFFPVRTIVTIPSGVSLTQIAEMLKQEQVIRSKWFFVVATHLKGLETDVKAGDYYFNERLTALQVVSRLTAGAYGLEPIRVMVPEGATTYQMAQLYERQFERFSVDRFLMLAQEKEGYLFPDTYFFLPNVTTVEILQTMERTFYERLRSIEEKIAAFGRPVHEVVTMASLLEKEARDFEERRAIAGVLWKRLQINMPLQVDAVFGFIKKTNTFNPTFSDLDVDSEYNTYKYGGLPPGPIGSPSLQALEAAVSPIETDALFYLHGRDGMLRLAHTYDEHLENRRRYLD